jgi:hypothetical protein
VGDLHEFDSHLSVVRRQLLRLTDRSAAPRPETGDQPCGVDAEELPLPRGIAWVIEPLFSSAGVYPRRAVYLRQKDIGR